MNRTIEEALNPTLRAGKLRHLKKRVFPYPILPRTEWTIPPLNFACIVLSFFFDPHLSNSARARLFGTTERNIAHIKNKMHTRATDERNFFIRPLVRAHFIFQIYATRRPLRELAREAGISTSTARRLFDRCDGANLHRDRRTYTPPPPHNKPTGGKSVIPLFRLAATAAKLATSKPLSEIAKTLGISDFSVQLKAHIPARARLALVDNFPEMGSTRKKNNKTRPNPAAVKQRRRGQREKAFRRTRDGNATNPKTNQHKTK